MHLNIKSDEAHELAAALARLTGESITGAVTQAIRQRLDDERRARSQQALASELLEIGRRCAAHGAQRQQDRRSHGDFLYDQRGLPKT
jgi:antitoxin VapB